MHPPYSSTLARSFIPGSDELQEEIEMSWPLMDFTHQTAEVTFLRKQQCLQVSLPQSVSYIPHPSPASPPPSLSVCCSLSLALFAPLSFSNPSLSCKKLLCIVRKRARRVKVGQGGGM